MAAVRSGTYFERESMETGWEIFTDALTFILIITSILLAFQCLRMLFNIKCDSPFDGLEHNSPDMQLYIAMEPGEPPSFRVQEKYEQKLDNSIC
ncbi:hypothetical protein NPIL_683361 [Nephila pilipes]|uniref:Uncharacterized protein n=1 Tax=Nephila pilipes TaxID=299642 RepID=A0A8X6UKV8_NEPPI|nr:hypothetical protein NPIL_683361 [Nephila pilipes]